MHISERLEETILSETLVPGEQYKLHLEFTPKDDGKNSFLYHILENFNFSIFFNKI